MTNDYLRPSDRLRCVAPECWSWKLALVFIALAIVLALMCENVNAAPQGHDSRYEVASPLETVPSQLAKSPVGAAPFTLASDMPPFSIGHPICPGGFTIAQRYDERNAAGTITKSVWVRKCTKGRIVYGRKV